MTNAPTSPKPPATRRYTVAVDFDGVIHSYTTPWKNAHTIPDPPVDGAIDWLWKVIQSFDVVIFSTRCKSWRGRRAMRQWLRHYAGNLWYPAPDGLVPLEEIRFSREKPPALIYLDDRAVRFNGPGSFPTKDEIHRSRPWNK